ncbi:YheE family protein [Peribacillus sp. B-H-3]|uniref:YheE family protein n=1 Tax=Peribacillus sp. B-H-3 TaxID=3400420 RepID=UPI003B012E57
MITHFQWKPLFEDEKLPGWRISFYYKKQHFQGIYHPEGRIEWTGHHPAAEEEKNILAMVHELMLYHVYES